MDKNLIISLGAVAIATTAIVIDKPAEETKVVVSASQEVQDLAVTAITSGEELARTCEINDVMLDGVKTRGWLCDGGYVGRREQDWLTEISKGQPKVVLTPRKTETGIEFDAMVGE